MEVVSALILRRMPTTSSREYALFPCKDACFLGYQMRLAAMFTPYLYPLIKQCGKESLVAQMIAWPNDLTGEP